MNAIVCPTCLTAHHTSVYARCYVCNNLLPTNPPRPEPPKT